MDPHPTQNPDLPPHTHGMLFTTAPQACPPSEDLAGVGQLHRFPQYNGNGPVNDEQRSGYGRDPWQYAQRRTDAALAMEAQQHAVWRMASSQQHPGHQNGLWQYAQYPSWGPVLVQQHEPQGHGQGYPAAGFPVPYQQHPVNVQQHPGHQNGLWQYAQYPTGEFPMPTQQHAPQGHAPNYPTAGFTMPVQQVAYQMQRHADFIASRTLPQPAPRRAGEGVYWVSKPPESHPDFDLVEYFKLTPINSSKLPTIPRYSHLAAIAGKYHKHKRNGVPENGSVPVAIMPESAAPTSKSRPTFQEEPTTPESATPTSTSRSTSQGEPATPPGPYGGEVDPSKKLPDLNVADDAVNMRRRRLMDEFVYKFMGKFMISNMDIEWLSAEDEAFLNEDPYIKQQLDSMRDEYVTKETRRAARRAAVEALQKKAMQNEVARLLLALNPQYGLGVSAPSASTSNAGPEAEEVNNSTNETEITDATQSQSPETENAGTTQSQAIKTENSDTTESQARKTGNSKTPQG
ncbi:hypothetical protein EJ04DRAFT_554786 [Polyplosphaeria fusca]|uniref:Uncharacterized protein n=1 Tax=Polyplosphaeria fusca TaxID=682080 RepID=A0A9P4QRZ1_9PLEO|nr:hypothetical protein EJ04DRAFT_554786 [Polyplosphaeria fusca]